MHASSSPYTANAKRKTGSFLFLELPTEVWLPWSGRRNRLAHPVAVKKAPGGRFHKTRGGKSR